MKTQIAEKTFNHAATLEHISTPSIELIKGAPDSATRSHFAEALKKDRIPQKLREELNVLNEKKAISKQMQAEVEHILAEFLPGLDLSRHPVRVLTTNNGNSVACRVKHTPTTTIAIDLTSCIENITTRGELALVVLHEVCHALFAKGYRPHHLFDPLGIHKFSLVPELESNKPDTNSPDNGKPEESAAYTIPLLLLADAGYNPRIYESFFTTLFAPQLAMRSTENFSLCTEILDVHPLPETVDGLCEIVCALWIYRRGQLPTKTTMPISELKEAAAKLTGEIDIPQSRLTAGLESLAPDKKLELLIERLEKCSDISVSQVEEATAFLSTFPALIFHKRLTPFVDRLADIAISTNNPSLYYCICTKFEAEDKNYDRIFGKNLRLYVEQRATLIDAIENCDQKRILEASRAFATHWEQEIRGIHKDILTYCSGQFPSFTFEMGISRDLSLLNQQAEEDAYPAEGGRNEIYDDAALAEYSEDYDE
ncbi:MAG: hypothetical protein KDD62_02045, partial [Bdellovibrionales bacterium]|nr:hypothetical protein [Bdellovibrionales bacterium]